MSQCPYSNLLDPDTYSDGMPYQKLSDMCREAGPVIKMDDPITGVPYWAILGCEEMDYISKSPKVNFCPGSKSQNLPSHRSSSALILSMR